MLSLHRNIEYRCHIAFFCGTGRRLWYLGGWPKEEDNHRIQSAAKPERWKNQYHTMMRECNTNLPFFTQSTTAIVFGTRGHPELHLIFHFMEPRIVVIHWGVALVQVKCSSDLCLQESHLQEVYCDALGQYRLGPWEDAIGCDILVIHLLEKLNVDMIVTGREATWTTKAM